MEAHSAVRRHVKSGGLYIIVDEGYQESDASPVVVYKSLVTGTVWVRPAVEFFDGRFRVLTDTEVKRMLAT